MKIKGSKDTPSVPPPSPVFESGEEPPVGQGKEKSPSHTAEISQQARDAAKGEKVKLPERTTYEHLNPKGRKPKSP